MQHKFQRPNRVEELIAATKLSLNSMPSDEKAPGWATLFWRVNCSGEECTQIDSKDPLSIKTLPQLEKRKAGWVKQTERM
jgi:hypothetical protein